MVRDDMPEYLNPDAVDNDPDSADQSPEYQSEIIISEAEVTLIAENIETYSSVLGQTLAMIDPYCGPIAAEHAKEIAQKWAKVVSHYPAAAEFFLSKRSGMFFDYIAAFKATWPVLQAVYDHHLAGNIRVENGVAYRVVKVPPQDATLPEFIQGERQA